MIYHIILFMKYTTQTLHFTLLIHRNEVFILVASFILNLTTNEYYILIGFKHTLETARRLVLTKYVKCEANVITISVRKGCFGWSPKNSFGYRYCPEDKLYFISV